MTSFYNGNYGKPWWQSKTVLFNVVAFIVLVLTHFGYTGDLPPGADRLAEFAVILINLALRFVTKEPVKLPLKS